MHKVSLETLWPKSCSAAVAMTPRAKTIAIFGLIFMGAWALAFIIAVGRPNEVYKKDFVQEYLMAQAPRYGLNPYANLNLLSERIIGWSRVFPHPSAHPPLAAVVVYPIGFFSYTTAAGIWLIFELSCFFSSIYLLARYLEFEHTLSRILCYMLLMLGWAPFRAEFSVGQLTSFILLLLISSWLLLRKGRDKLGGALIGLAVALKLIAWPLMILLLLKKRWRAAFSSALAAILGNVIGALYLGFDSLVYYYAQIPKIVLPVYRGHVANLSVYSLGWRIFSGTETFYTPSLHAQPLMYAPNLASLVSSVLVLLTLVIGLYIAHRASFDSAFAIVTCICILVSPLVWSHYYIVLVLPLAILWKQRPMMSVSLVLTALLLWLPPIPGTILEKFYTPVTTSPMGWPIYSFSITLWTFLPIFGVLGLVSLLRRSTNAGPVYVSDPSLAVQTT